ncbi:hypothetical protein PoB_002246000 [Plakobranchus ocellatus]|uniref:Uncharacterized protein n=1 Tax=Plakobranchus ocellatus TaxID=259542 RepID=A0AAV3ZLF7_9GAST|nr:hypothetical protein PoB_002246000 [Plakobranchus ocellatus]
MPAGAGYSQAMRGPQGTTATARSLVSSIRHSCSPGQLPDSQSPCVCVSSMVRSFYFSLPRLLLLTGLTAVLD